ncbi:MAG: 4-hydroxythreonine-4-phosphate dehydrogenase PdxA [Planctomycetaceae bacterium]
MTAITDADQSVDKPTIGLTLGDVAGIGPEVVVRACADPRVLECCRPVVFGHPDILGKVGIARHTRSNCITACDEAVLDVPPGTVDARAGRAARDCLVAATESALRGEIDALVTAPLNKAALRLAGFDVPGHTEILAELCGVDRYAMMLYLRSGVVSPQGLCVAHVTLHTSIASVPDLLTSDGIVETIELVGGFLRDVGCNTPRIAVCALNPHAGEDGLFGDEEARIIAPAVETARSAGRNVAGPLPADTLIRRAVNGEFDGLVAMYHDQGHIPFKLIGFDRAVNVTLGLPIVRTSPSHGTAFDIAGTGAADPAGMIEAVRVAVLLAKSRRGVATGIDPSPGF